VLLGALLLGAAGAPAGAVEPAPECVLGARDRQWLERGAAAWSEVRRERLLLGPAAPPLILLFDERCTYRLEPARGAAGRGPPLDFDGTALHAVAAPHDGRVRLPDGRELEPAATAFTSLLPSDSTPFVTIAAEAIWRRDPDQGARPADWDRYLPRALVPEVVHARQLAVLAQRLRPLQQYFGVAVLDDDAVQQRFGRARGFRASVERERDLLLDAGTARGRDEARRDAAAALRLLRERRARHFTGEAEPFAELEDLFLDAEGAAQWAAFSALRRDAPAGADLGALVESFRQGEEWWSQDEGFALYLALDALVPGWQRRIFGPSPPSAVELLAEALALSTASS
jgi:hypothetical protein